MAVKEMNVEGLNCFCISGKLDIKASAETQDYILPLIRENAPVVLDMTECSYVSSTGLRALLTIAKKAASVNAKMALVSVSEDIWEVMEITGFDSLFLRYGDVSEASREMGMNQ